MSTGDSLPRSPLLLAASVTRSIDSLEQSDTRTMSPQSERRGSPWFWSSRMTPGGHTCSSSGSASDEKKYELSRTSISDLDGAERLMVAFQ